MPQRIDSLTVSINGRLDPSVIKMINDAEAQLKRLGASSRTSGAVMNRIFKDAFDGAEKAAKQTDRFGESMRRAMEVGAGVSIGEVLVKGLEAGVRMVERMAGGMKDMAMSASDIAAKFEMQSKGIGNLLRNQPFADSLLRQLQKVADLSPFMLSEMATTARSLTARGVPKEDLFQRSKEIGDIVAGIGGTAPEMERVVLAIGEAISGETVTTREINQLTQVGVPIWAELKRMTGKSVADLHKLVEKHGLDSKVLLDIFTRITSAGGIFNEGMLNFSKTFTGLLTTFHDKTNQFMRKFGFVINDWTGDVLRWVNSGDLFPSLFDWLDRIRGWSDSVRSYFSTIAAPEIATHLQALGDVWLGFFKKMTGGFDIATMFDEVRIPNQGLVEVLNSKGDAWMKSMTAGFTDAIDRIKEMNQKCIELQERLAPLVEILSKLKDIVTVLDDTIYGQLIPAFTEIGKRLASILQLVGIKVPGTPELKGPGLPGSTSPELGAFAQLPLFHGAVNKSTEALDRMTETINLMVDTAKNANANATAFPYSSMGHFPITGVPGASTGNIRVEGYGPSYGEYGQVTGNHNNPLVIGDYAVSPDLAAGHRPGETFTFPDSKGRIHHGRYNDASYKTPGRPNTNTIEGWNQPDLGTTPGIKWDKPTTFNIHIHAIDSDSFASTIHKHSEIIAHHVQRVFGETYERSSVV